MGKEGKREDTTTIKSTRGKRRSGREVHTTDLVLNGARVVPSDLRRGTRSSDTNSSSSSRVS